MLDSILLICLIVALAIMIPAMTIATAATTTTAEPYYSKGSFNPFLGVAGLYTCLAHFWIFGIRRQRNNTDIVQLLPPPPPPSEASTGGVRKLAIVTGSNTGIGLETARTLVVDYGWEVVLACRSQDKAIRAMVEINQQVTTSGGKAVVLEQAADGGTAAAAALDLSDFQSIQAFTDAIETQYPHRSIDVLVNNAGRNTCGKSGKFDILFQANFLGHFVLTKRLLNKLKGGRIINLSSVMHHFVGPKPKDAAFWKSVSLFQDPPAPEIYGASKLAAILFTNELNRRYAASHNIHSMAVNPGGVSSDIWRGFPKFMQAIFRMIYLTPRQGCSTSVAAAVKEDWGDATYLQPYWQPNGEETPVPVTELIGPYVGYYPVKPRLPKDGGLKDASALWKTSEELTGISFP
jgi:NAD(P)-dependent dehydrogenase (short-subunit alcohol dehydrogenase family)